MWIRAELTAYFQHIENGHSASSYTGNLVVTRGYNAFQAGVLSGGVPVDISYTQGDGVATKVNAAVTAFQAKHTAVKAHFASAKTGASVGNCAFYKGGLSFYKVMIKHDDSPTVNNELGEFGVVRNSIYTITIKKFNNPGYPTIPDPDPKKPDETDEGWLTVEVNVNPWTNYNQEEDL